MPVLYPNLSFCEEGAYIIYEDSLRIPILVVSPDGSLRYTKDGVPDLDRDIPASVEIKCPISIKEGCKVYQSVPKRYIPQCLMEQLAMKSKSQLLLCWSPESSTLFRVPFDKEIADKILSEAVRDYYASTPKRQTKLSPEVKQLSKSVGDYVKQCEFLGEFPSAKTLLMDNQRHLKSIQQCFPYYPKDNGATKSYSKTESSISV
ncbi:hypothetical protein FSP39_025403 [Pinctada imbricata]|uniref:YqaJ viral recombinase domain-containing protein n=1 Tax=Pinctada imbricata TaxID=66713 RepID=A0AA89C069_PINIB|nr:hypothetical protein FSP39_025403 [Pinctada imbricata]